MAGNNAKYRLRNIYAKIERTEKNNFKSFEDKRMVECQEVYFYKLAQLLVSDILHLRECKENVKIDGI